MQRLRYTNAILTIIALALSVIAIEGAVRPSTADPVQVQPVAICDMVGHSCLDVVRDFKGSFISVRPRQ